MQVFDAQIDGQGWLDRDAKRVHSIYMLELVGNVGPILAATDRNKAIKGFAFLFLLAEDAFQDIHAAFPIEGFLFFSPAACVAKAIFVKGDAGPCRHCNTAGTPFQIINRVH